MNGVIDRYHSMLFSYDPPIKGSKFKKVCYLASDAVKGGIEIGLIFGACVAVTVFHIPLITKKKIYERPETPLIAGALVFAGSLVISAILAVVKCINFYLKEKAIRDAELTRIENERLQREKSEQELLEVEIPAPFGDAVTEWRSNQNIEPLLNVLEKTFPPYLGKIENSQTPIPESQLQDSIDQIGRRNSEDKLANKAIYSCLLDACTQMEQRKFGSLNSKLIAKSNRIFSVMIDIGVHYLEQAEKIGSEPYKYHFYVAASRWLSKPAQKLLENEACLKHVHELNKSDLVAELKQRIPKLARAAGIYCYLVDAHKFEPDQMMVGLLDDLLEAALKEGSPFAKYTQALRLISKNKIPAAKILLKDLLNVPKEAGIDLAKFAQEKDRKLFEPLEELGNDAPQDDEEPQTPNI